MCFQISETPFFSAPKLCFYVLDNYKAMRFVHFDFLILPLKANDKATQNLNYLISLIWWKKFIFECS